MAHRHRRMILNGDMRGMTIRVQRTTWRDSNDNVFSRMRCDGYNHDDVAYCARH